MARLKFLGPLILFVFFSFGTVSMVIAQNQGAGDDLSELENLLEKEVTVTGRKESAKESPAILTVMTSDQIDKINPQSLNDLLRRVPGVEVVETYFGYSSVHFRGVKQSHYNNKSVLLMNGHPIYESTRGSFNTSAVPVNAIKRLEVVRGPDSVNYGTNAYAGIINVITKDGSDLQGSGEVKATAGTFSTRGFSLLAGDEGDNYSLSVAGSLNESDGYDFFVESDELGASGDPFYGTDEPGYENDFFNGVVQGEYRDLSMQVYSFNQDKDKYGIVPRLASTGKNHRTQTGIDLSYTFLDNDSTKLELFSWYDESEVKNILKNYPPAPGFTSHYESYDNNKFGADLEFNYDVTENLNLLSGLVYEEWYSGPDEFIELKSQNLNSSASAFTESYSTDEQAFYGKIQYDITDWWTANVGARLADNSEFGSQEAYNARSVFTPTDQLTVKALYGQAYRAPSFFEKRVNTPGVLYGLNFQEPSNKFSPELIDNYDLLLSYRMNNQLFEADFFQLTTDDVLNRRGVNSSEQSALGEPASTAIYDNLPGQEISGVTLSYKHDIDNHQYKFDLTHKSGENTDSNSDVTGIAELTGMASYNYTMNDKDFNLWLKHVGERENNSTVDSYNLLEANMNWHFTDSTTLSLKGKNLLDEDYDYPEFIRSNINTIPGGPSRAYYVSLTTAF